MARTTTALVLLAALLAASGGSSAAAAAPAQCRASPEVGVGPDLDSAEGAWKATVAKAYGDDWSDLQIAAKQTYSSSGKGFTTVFFFIATPCHSAAAATPTDPPPAN